MSGFGAPGSFKKATADPSTPLRFAQDDTFVWRVLGSSGKFRELEDFEILRSC
jgi:hypothetical protein